MNFAYEIQDKSVKIWRCFSYGTKIEVPDRLAGYPVAELAPYAFSAHMEEEKLEEKIRSGQLLLSGENEEPALCGFRLKGIYLPAALQKIGAYAFYNCGCLEHFSFHGSLKDLGAGLFTGCHHVRQLELTLDDTGTSCLQEILMELNEELRLTIYRGNEEARLVFPEFYEEGVENTPARILMTQMHGSGMHFRNCFYRKRFDFHAYDGCFFRAKAQEDRDSVLELALGRLRFSMELGAEGRTDYEKYLREHLPEAGLWAIEQRDMKLLNWLVKEHLPGSPEEEIILRRLLGQAAERGFTEGNGFLLSVLHGRFSSREELFEF
jgi:hypothetical protein